MARRIESDSESDEEFPNAWEELRRRLEPVSPAAEESREVIEIVDDPLGDEPPFEVLISYAAAEEPESQEPEPAPAPAPAPAPEPEEPEPEESAPEEPAPEQPAPEEPQPGPSGIQDDNDEEMEERWLSTIDRNCPSLGEDNDQYVEFEQCLETAMTGFTAIMDKMRSTATLALDYKEAYRTSRRALKRKREDIALLEADLDRERKRAREALDANEMLIRDMETEQRESREYKEQRDLAERDVTTLKSEMARMRHKAYTQKQYVKALKGTLEDKDATIARLEAELTQVRTRLHQFTRISVPRGQRPGCSSWIDGEDSTEEET